MGPIQTCLFISFRIKSPVETLPQDTQEEQLPAREEVSE